MSSETGKSRRKREWKTARLLNTPRTLDVILAHVRNGGSLISLCETWDVRYSDIVKWIRDDKARSEAYTGACEDRSEWTDEMLLSELRSSAVIDFRRFYYPKGHEKAGQRRPIHELEPELGRMIEEIGKDGKLKLVNRQKSIEMLARVRRLLTDKTELEIGGRLEDILAKSYEDEAPKPAPVKEGPAA